MELNFKDTFSSAGHAARNHLLPYDRTANETTVEEAVLKAFAAGCCDDESADHLCRIGPYTVPFAVRAGLGRVFADTLEKAAVMHDVGKVGIPYHILQKRGRLTDEERAIMQSHTTIGAKILANPRSAVAQMGQRIALLHHERYDGSGYPNGLRANEIPIEARILAVCDVYDALRSHRPYKSALPHEEVVRIILEGDGRTSPEHFDPLLLEIFKQIHLQMDEIYNSWSNDCGRLGTGKLNFRNARGNETIEENG